MADLALDSDRLLQVAARGGRVPLVEHRVAQVIKRRLPGASGPRRSRRMATASSW